MTTPHLPPHKPSRCVLQIAYGRQSLSELEVTRENHRDYARRLGAEYVELVQPTELSYGPAAKFRAVQVAKEFDQTLFLDNDTVVLRPEWNLFELCPIGWWGVVDEMFLFKNPMDEFRDVFRQISDSLGMAQPEFSLNLNSGVMILPRDADLYLPPNKPLPNHWCIEQIWLSHQLLSHGVPFVRLDPRCNWCFWFRDFSLGLRDAIVLHWNNRQDRLAHLRHWTQQAASPFP